MPAPQGDQNGRMWPNFAKKNARPCATFSMRDFLCIQKFLTFRAIKTVWDKMNLDELVKSGRETKEGLII